MILSVLTAALLTAQGQFPLPPAGVAPTVLDLTAETLQCVERQIPPTIHIIEQGIASNGQDQESLTSGGPSLVDATVAVRRCFATAPARPHADDVAVSYVLINAASQALGQWLASQGVTEDILQRADRLALLNWLSRTGSITTPDQAQELARRLGRLHVPVQARSQTFMYLWARRVVDLFSIWMRPPAQRAVWLGGAIEASDYPFEPLRLGTTGTGAVVFEVRPDGSVGRCVIFRTTGHEAFGPAACRAITRRYRYQPALDANGNPTRDAVAVNIDWRLPG